VIHVTTPANHLHAPVTRGAIATSKHVISESRWPCRRPKPAIARRARQAGIVHAVSFNYRGNPMVQQVRQMVAEGEIGPVHFVHGAYLQDWLIEDTDYSWRLEPDKGGRSSAFADIGSHWCDMAQHLVGARITSVLAELTTVVKTRLKPAHVQTFGKADDPAREAVTIESEDLATILLRFENGVKGSVNIGQVCAGHKNDFWLEVNGRLGSLRWRQEDQNHVWFGSRRTSNRELDKDPSLIGDGASPCTCRATTSRAGLVFCNVISRHLPHIASGSDATKPPAFATLPMGTARRIIDAVLASHDNGGVWTPVRF
jgi:predicted dehydrogenase